MKAIRDLTMQMQFIWNTVDVGTAGSTVIIHQITFRPSKSSTSVV